MSYDIKKQKVKSKRSLTLEERVNAEFKHLKLRIRKLEQIVLKQHDELGSIKEPNKRLKKG